MGQKCCTDRKDAGSSGGGSKDKQPDLSSRKSVAGGGYDNKKRAISIGYHSKGDDSEKFDKAFETNDLKAFVELLASQQAIESFDERMHPWAEDPKTVGALAGTQLAILASAAEQAEGNKQIKDDIRKAGAIPPLVDFLKSDQNDRVQTAVVALSFLTADCRDNVVAAYEAGALELMLKLVDSKVAGERAAAATTLRNICMEDDVYRKKFVELGGIQALVNQLDTTPDPSLNHADVQLEAVLNLQDMVETEDGQTIEEYAKLAVKAGAIPKLQELEKSEDKEVVTSAQEVLEALQAYA
ncbi:unnamed protein product [Effrenium voratum]|uniref:Uncharacterized protein n=1 Tax=Effrenium voratum TaxID=2562239 RepID=A0AA36NN94_9DINO|nr:unnamed protein product [Effrenium voratum]CAJ1411143.1 unnamed protein product [Effrenium voratum]CAJ1449760.1 unnamed protein product [Effrenium voratum]